MSLKIKNKYVCVHCAQACSHKNKEFYRRRNFSSSWWEYYCQKIYNGWECKARRKFLSDIGEPAHYEATRKEIIFISFIAEAGEKSRRVSVPNKYITDSRNRASINLERAADGVYTGRTKKKTALSHVTGNVKATLRHSFRDEVIDRTSSNGNAISNYQVNRLLQLHLQSSGTIVFD